MSHFPLQGVAIPADHPAPGPHEHPVALVPHGDDYLGSFPDALRARPVPASPGLHRAPPLAHRRAGITPK